MIFKKIEKPDNWRKLLKTVLIEIKFIPNKEDVVEFTIVERLRTKGFDKLERLQASQYSEAEKIFGGPNFPTCRLTNGKYAVYVGNGIVAIRIDEAAYESWKNISQQVQMIVSLLSDVIFSINSIVVNYVNFSDEDTLLEELKLNSSIDALTDSKVGSFSNTITYVGDNYSIVLVLSNEAKFKLLESEDKFQIGSVIDINAISKKCDKDNIYSTINEMHDDIENVYFGILDKLR